MFYKSHCQLYMNSHRNVNNVFDTKKTLHDQGKVVGEWEVETTYKKKCWIGFLTLDCLILWQIIFSFRQN